ncbi:hypothetical protein ATE47_02385 [Chryseobacterium sp. IHB B 17019]|uniref:hypothetical protein n=1 Tax=Chryseobacterium sp. IHB B 17019 TaxID=1721091 RepID=UPI000722D786|nr:hypothetical protein [Chryseobacterium sp. IHB B 17019]ALR29451.1 hypothetical protein ATE47_02385 [Chryseobacterium sp. IHB B 17019]
MNKNFKLTGGVKIGSANLTYPFVDLYVDENIFKINASLLGSFIFQPQDIISIKPHNSFPLFGQGIKIYHRVTNYDQNVIFWTIKNPNFVINEIKNTGFLDKMHLPLTEKDPKIIEQQKQGGFPIKLSVAIGFFIIWNLCIWYEFIPMFKQNNSHTFGYGISTALGMLFITALMTLISKEFRGLILKEGKGLEDVKKFVIFLILISGIMFTAFITLTLS